VVALLASTSESPDPELQNRCLTLHVSEDPEQTETIHARQRAAYTVDGRQALADCEAIQKLHQNAQRLPKRYTVIIPSANRLTFRRDQPGMRRDHAKYLSLIASITLLHQYQRSSRPGPTGEMDYLEATFDDIERANELASKVLGRTLDSLMAQTRQLLVLLDDYVGQRCQREDKSRLELRFTQREIREALGWGDFQLRRHLRRLVELEYVLVHRTKRGNQREYELLYDGQGRDGEPFVLGLFDVAKLGRAQYDNRNDKYDNRNDRLAERNGAHPMPLRSAIDAHSMGAKNDASANGNGQLGQPLPKPSGNGQEPPRDF
jgi:hypothetical protein